MSPVTTTDVQRTALHSGPAPGVGAWLGVTGSLGVEPSGELVAEAPPDSPGEPADAPGVAADGTVEALAVPCPGPPVPSLLVSGPATTPHDASAAISAAAAAARAVFVKKL
jgi:hypothetical protein